MGEWLLWLTRLLTGMVMGLNGQVALSCSFRVADPEYLVVRGGPDELPSRFVVESIGTILLWVVADVTKVGGHHSDARCGAPFRQDTFDYFSHGGWHTPIRHDDG
jgi:hypothetical protein